MIELQILLVFMILAAIAAVELKDTLGAVIAVGAVGLGVSIAFLFLQAPDLAIVQLVVEILCLVFLIRAVFVAGEVFKDKWRVTTALPAIMLVVLFLFFATKALLEIPSFGYPILKVAQRYIEHGLKETGAANIVASVILDYRALDTLGEAIVLFTAVIGVFAVMRKIGRKK